MTDYIIKTAEDVYGIKTDPDDAKKLRDHIREKYGAVTQETVKKVFATGEAAGFVTVNETYFFREPAHFEFLLNRLSDLDHSDLRILSAATSTGCEAYSIAILLETYKRNMSKHLNYQIDAFDINQDVIKIAREGIFGERSMREDGSSFRYMADPFIEKTGSGYKAAESLKSNINFFVHNLMDAVNENYYHLIFFRNAFIYFSPAARSRVLSNLSIALKENGLLILGVSETAGARHESLVSKNVNDVFYLQKQSSVVY